MIQYQAPGTTRDKSLEIVTPEWQYFDNDDFNFNEDRVVPVKEQRRMGTQRGNKTTPQAPAIEVRAKGLPDGPVACRCRLWNFGSCIEREAPRHDGTAQQLTMLRANVMIDVTENLAMFGPVLDDGYRYARLRCFITRGARVQCKKFHIAFFLDCVHIPPNMAVPGPDDSSFPTGDLIQGFPWARSARMSISEKAMCPRMHDKAKKARARSQKSGGGSSGNDSDSGSSAPSPTQSSPKRLKRIGNAPGSAMTHSSVNSGSHPSAMPLSGKKGLSPAVIKKKENGVSMAGGMQVQNGSGLLMAPMGGMPPNPGIYNTFLDRQMRMSRFSFPGLDDEVMPHQGMQDEGDLANMESALGHGRRSSQFIGGQYWGYQAPQYYLGQNPGLSHQQGGPGGPQSVGMNGSNPSANGLNNASPLPVANHSPTFTTLQPTLSFDFGSELSHRRLSASGTWGSAELQSRRISAADISRLSASPIPATQPGRGQDWDALFEAHTKVVLLDKSSPDYLSKKTVALAEVQRAIEVIEQRLQKR